MNLKDKRFDASYRGIGDDCEDGSFIECKEVVDFILHYENTTDPTEILTLLKEQLK